MAGALLFASIPGAAFVPQPDIASSRGVTIGGLFVPWGGEIVLQEEQATLRANGRCAFRISYDMVNNGSRASAPFKNFLTAMTRTVAINATVGLGAGESRDMATQSFLVPGSYPLALRLDAESALSETDESNNGYFVNVILRGQCQGRPPR
jgi:hypothetical protein